MRIDAFANRAIQVSLAATDSCLVFGDKRRDVEFFFHVCSLVDGNSALEAPNVQIEGQHASELPRSNVGLGHVLPL